MTDNHGLNTPQKGTSDWHIPLNENFEAIDTGMEIRDVSTNKSDYVPKNGAKFFATDTGTVYVGNGDRWKPIRSSGVAPSFQSAALNGEYMDSWPQTDYQVGSGDSIQDAVDQLSNATDCAVIDITQEYDESVETRPIKVDAPVHFVGRGIGENAKIRFPKDGTAVFELDSPTHPWYRFGFSNLHIEGGLNALDVVSATNLFTQNCFFQSQQGAAVDYTGAEFSGLSVHYHSIVRYAGGEGGTKAGWELRDAKTEPNATAFIECQSMNNDGPGVGLGGYGTSWRGGTIERNDGPGLVFEGRGNFVVEDTYFEANARSESGLTDTDIYVNNRGEWDTILKHTWQAGGGVPASNHIVIDGRSDRPTRNVEVITPRGRDAKLWAEEELTGVVRVTQRAMDCRLQYDDSKVRTIIDDDAQRIATNNRSTNQGDPRNTGEWYNHGYTGLRVRDVENGRWFEYINGRWIPS